MPFLTKLTLRSLPICFVCSSLLPKHRAKDRDTLIEQSLIHINQQIRDLTIKNNKIKMVSWDLSMYLLVLQNTKKQRMKFSTRVKTKYYCKR